MFVLCTSLLYLSLTLLASGALSQSPVEELKVCQTELKQCLHKLSNVESDTYLGRVCQWVANPNKGGRETLKTTVHNLLHAAQLEHTDHVGDHFELDLVLSMKNSELVALRRFLLTDQGEEKEIQDILKDSFKIRTSNSLKSKSSSFQFSKEKLISFISHEGFIVFQILLLSSLLIFFLWRGVALWRIAVVLVIGSVAWTWIHLYKVALSKKQATLSRLGETPQRCLVEKQGWAAAFKGAWYSALGIQDNKCEAYYEALMVDPFWEITPLKAITETASQFVLRPLEVLGSSIGIFFSGILEPIPIFWKIPVLIVGLIVIVLLLLMGCRYRIKSPLLFSIEPSSSDSKTGDLIKSLTTGGSKKRDKKKALEKETDDEDSERDTASARPTKKSENNLPYPSGPNLLDHWVDPTQRHH